MSTLLIGERFNGATWRPMCAIPSHKYISLQLKWGVFRHGPSRQKLASVGINFHESMNILPPDLIQARWDELLARTVADFIREMQWERIFLCGQRVADAFYLPEYEFGTCFALEPRTVAYVVPHPTSKWWKSYENRALLKERLDAWRPLSRKVSVSSKEAKRKAMQEVPA